jgi:hypothetical protein
MGGASFLVLFLFAATVAWPAWASPRRLGGGSGVRSDVDAHGRSAVFELPAGGTVQKNDGQYAVRSISGRVFLDRNADGEPDDGAAGLEGAEVEIFAAGGGLVRVEHTDARGEFAAPLDPGRYHLVLFCPDGFHRSPRSGRRGGSVADPASGETAAYVVGPASVADVNLGCYRLGALRGVAFQDSNLNSLREDWKQGVAGVRVRLRSADDTSFQRFERTGASGEFAFADLPPGAYALDLEADAAFHHSLQRTRVQRRRRAADAPGARPGADDAELEDVDVPTVVLADGQSELTTLVSVLGGETVIVEQGLYTLARVEGTVFEDLDADGELSDGDRVLPNVPVHLFRDDDVLVRESLSNADGGYLFDGLEPGRYYVRFDAMDADFKHSHRE